MSALELILFAGAQRVASTLAAITGLGGAAVLLPIPPSPKAGVADIARHRQQR